MQNVYAAAVSVSSSPPLVLKSTFYEWIFAKMRTAHTGWWRGHQTDLTQQRQWFRPENVLPRDVGNLRMTLNLIRSEEWGLINLQGDPWKKMVCIRYLHSWVNFLHVMELLQQLLLPSYILTCFLLRDKGAYLKLHIILKWPQEYVWGMVFCLAF